MSNAPDFGPEAKALYRAVFGGKTPLARHTVIYPDQRAVILAAIQAFGAAAYRRGQDDETETCAFECDVAQANAQEIIDRVTARNETVDRSHVGASEICKFLGDYLRARIAARKGTT